MTFLPWLKLIVCAALILIAAPMLTRYSDVIARKAGLSHSLAGLLLLATTTSVPELFTGISSVTIAAVPDIAVGNALGACIFNLLMLVFLDLMSREDTIYRRIDHGHILTAGFSIILLGFAGAFMFIGRGETGYRFFHIGVATPLLIVLYFVAMRSVFIYERRSVHALAPMAQGSDVPLRVAVFRYLLAAVMAAGAGSWLPFVAVEISELMGWRTTFVGTIFAAAATSLPEATVTYSALRMRAFDMAIGNLLGSNLLAVFILGVDDVAFTKGPLLSMVSMSHAVTVFAAIIMTGIFVVALLYRPQHRLFGVIGWASFALVTVYLVVSFVIFLGGH